MTMPAPSPRTQPSAAASKVLQRPSAANTPALEKLRLGPSVSITFTPPASASVDSPSRRLRQAMWMATNDDEHAVSTDMLGPRKSKM
jgi:hypothetical protein